MMRENEQETLRMWVGVQISNHNLVCERECKRGLRRASVLVC
jgi:hypothetical protein